MCFHTTLAFHFAFFNDNGFPFCLRWFVSSMSWLLLSIWTNGSSIYGCHTASGVCHELILKPYSCHWPQPLPYTQPLWSCATDQEDQRQNDVGYILGCIRINGKLILAISLSYLYLPVSMYIHAQPHRGFGTFCASFQFESSPLLSIDAHTYICELLQGCLTAKKSSLVNLHRNALKCR